MLKLKLSTAAELDIGEGIRYYNKQQAGLGKRFLATVKDGMKKIRQMPQAASFVFDDTRYKAVDKFPYIILYQFDEKHIRIIRVFNTSLDDKGI